MDPSTIAERQYSAGTDRLTARIVIHSYRTKPQSWFSWSLERVTVEEDVLEVRAGTGELWWRVDHNNARLTLAAFSPAMRAVFCTRTIEHSQRDCRTMRYGMSSVSREAFRLSYCYPYAPARR